MRSMVMRAAQQNFFLAGQDFSIKDYAYILKLIRDLLALLADVKDVLGGRVKTNTFLSWQNVIKSLHKVARGAGVKVGRVENHHTIAHVTIFYFYIIIISYRHAVGTFIIIFVDL